MSQDLKRRRSVAVEPAGHGENEGLGNLNRWSHSTNSSVASVGNTRRSRGGSGASLMEHHLSPQQRSAASIEQSSRSSPQRQALARRNPYSPDSSPGAVRRQASRPDFYTSSLTALPPLHTTPALINEDTESPSTIQTIATPSTQSSYIHDYFGGDDSISPRNTARNKKPAIIRNYTAPMTAANARKNTGPEAPTREQLRRSSTSDRTERESKPTSTGDEKKHKRSKTREGREKDKKAMLSKALQKANTAVLLDNAQNFEGALDAYSDACRLLQQVMDLSSADEDKRKLEAIWVTYTNRIEELKQLEPDRPSTAEDKTLPARPMSDDSIDVSSGSAHPRDSAVIETATMQRIVDVPRVSYPARDDKGTLFSRTIDAVEGSSKPEDMREVEEEQPAVAQRSLNLPLVGGGQYMPAPLSPRKLPSSGLRPEAEEAWTQEHGDESEQSSALSDTPLAQAETDDQSMTWLDTIDESGSETASMHRRSGDGLRRNHIRGSSDAAYPDFDTAFDAAVEAAYDEGYEPDMEARRKRKTAFKHAPKESIQISSGEIKELTSPTNEYHPTGSLGSELDDEEEEERLLDEITSDYAQGFNFDLSSKSALPRQSDSSGYSRSTWQSSQASGDRNTAATSLSTVAEDSLIPAEDPKLAEKPSSIGTLRPEQLPSASPAMALPQVPAASGNRLSGVRDRRLSGQSNLKQLKIETNAKPEARKRASTFHHSPSPRHETHEEKSALDKDFKFGTTLAPTPSDVQHDLILTSPPTLDMRSAGLEIPRPQTAAASEYRRSLEESPGELRSAVRPNLFKKNKSSVSLREHTILTSSPDDSAPSLMTPMSSSFMGFSHKRNQDPLTSQRAKFSSIDSSYAPSLSSGGAYLFDTSLTTQQPPTSPRSLNTTSQPAGLEPCPESFLLRPFWLMRGLASTLIHPKGGFLTTKLFVPREVWQTRGVKLRSVEDKVANCDLLTAALGRLAGVDTFDADAVMEELQSFEEVMERVQAALTKKLGSDVGLQGISALFKDAAPAAGAASSSSATTGSAGQNSSTDATTGAAGGPEKAAKPKESKSYLHSWRKLRSKSSGTPLASPHIGGSKAAAAAADKEVPVMASVPMTSFVPVEPRRGGGGGGGAGKRDARNVVFEGPQREYMGSLARLCEGVGILDQIARQVEDPGLKHSSPTHVGLELSIRHAAEFFAFYLCRFVLADLGILMDKFVKRGTEWVLS
ncbi:hypothetical protein B0A50_07201 [Salinomyces thailandicus]|uniref:MIT domain-containing protein n=1 Tax=Salinomyces thailandicus TaxID=706561 RepID=A0A4U0TMG9_9PEZI|nr:hypothetical protein B0A50_07201 [Salinomyces thailandica]